MRLDECFKQHKERLRASITAFCRDASLAEEAVAIAFMRAALQQQMLEDMPDRACVAWLYATARNAAVDELRRRRHWTLMAELPEPDREEDWEDEISVNRLLIEDLLATLPEHLGRTVSLRYLSGLSSAEIARREGLSAATVRTRLRTALAMMRKELEQTKRTIHV